MKIDLQANNSLFEKCKSMFELVAQVVVSHAANYIWDKEYVSKQMSLVPKNSYLQGQINEVMKNLVDENESFEKEWNRYAGYISLFSEYDGSILCGDDDQNFLRIGYLLKKFESINLEEEVIIIMKLLNALVGSVSDL